MLHSTTSGLAPWQGLAMCFGILTAFVLLCVTLATQSRLVRVLALVGFAIETLCTASLLAALIAHGVTP